ncbi:hypothetical protein CAPTEDRAFT_21307 [Capitella teleta]|uniref:Tetraspanin n=1 Tax=Capitella teleta TaxID=283909 RepID=R7U697_CAPTE|nr:hypothetical protein CAPTEDRAFT_21307 [Capitella teleta]|eukprot:ELU01489.1 hypothetical protein CAPTEDRAFT_21307 [Capitella teleta]
MEMMYAPNKGSKTQEQQHRPREMNQEMECIQCLRYVLFSYNLVIFLCGCALLGIGIWMGVDRNFLTTIIGNDLYAVAVFLILAMGGIIFFISFLGCCGAITERSCLIFTFMICLCVIFFGLLLGGILAIVFSAQLGENVRKTMADTLVNHYGVDFHVRYNRQVTDAWDKAQERLQCCAVETEGWLVYQESKWFELYGSNDEMRMSHEDQKPYVPQSCCVKDRFWRYINLEVCQKWRFGPPGAPVDGAINRALYYDGCYDAGLSYLKDNSIILIGLGIGIALLLVCGIVLSFVLLRYEKEQQGQ